MRVCVRARVRVRVCARVCVCVREPKRTVCEAIDGSCCSRRRSFWQQIWLYDVDLDDVGGLDPFGGVRRGVEGLGVVYMA